jgi:hypothetical protein
MSKSLGNGSSGGRGENTVPAAAPPAADGRGRGGGRPLVGRSITPVPLQWWCSPSRWRDLEMRGGSEVVVREVVH